MMLLGLVVIAHVGGIPTKAAFTAPLVLGEVADQGYAFSWLDDDMDLTGLFDFYYQPANIPPGAELGSEAFVGTPLPNGQGVAITEPTDVLTWDTSSVAAGSYYLYAITRDPPLAPLFGVSQVPITVQHAGDPRWPAVVVDEPNAVGDVQSTVLPVRFRARGEGPLTATLRGRELRPLDPQPFYDVVSDFPLEETSPGSFEACHLWDLTALVEGNHYVEVVVSDAAGHVHTAYSRTMTVSLAASGPTPTCDDPGETPDASPLPRADAGTPETGEGGGCVIGGASRTGSGQWSVLVLALAALGLTGLTRPHRTPRAGRRRRPARCR